MDSMLASIEATTKPRRGTVACLREIERDIAGYRAELAPLMVAWGKSRPFTKSGSVLGSQVARLQRKIEDLAEEAGITPARTRAELAIKARIAKGMYLYDADGEVCSVDEFLMRSLVDDLIRLG